MFSRQTSLGSAEFRAPGQSCYALSICLRAAAGILVGELKVFSLDCQFGSTPDWTRNLKTGTIAPFAFGKTLNYRDESVVDDIGPGRSGVEI